MSRIGKKAIAIPSGVEVKIQDRHVSVTGPKAKTPLTWEFPKGITVAVEGKQVVVTRSSDHKQVRAFHGLTRALINNMVIGASKGFEREMQIFGVGFSCNLQGSNLVMKIGFCHDVTMAVPAGVEVKIKTPAARGNDTPAEFTVMGSDKQAVGQFAANIRRVRPPEPYKGKGIRYKDEFVRRKEGKPLVSGG